MAFFHLVNTLVGMFVPFGRINETTPRFHHDFIGLILSLAPMRSFKLLGACYTFDSLLYFPFPERSFQRHGSYDFANVVLEHGIFPRILFTASLQKGLDSLHIIIEKQRKIMKRANVLCHYMQNLGERLRENSYNFFPNKIFDINSYASQNLGIFQSKRFYGTHNI